MGAFVPRVLLVGGVAGLMGLAYPAYAQEPPPPIIEEMLREALKTERKPVENILKRLYQCGSMGCKRLVDCRTRWLSLGAQPRAQSRRR